MCDLKSYWEYPQNQLRKYNDIQARRKAAGNDKV